MGDKDIRDNLIIPANDNDSKTLQEYAVEFAGKLGPYEEFDWEEGMGIERWMDAED